MSEGPVETVSFDFNATVRRVGGDESLLVPLIEIVERSARKLIHQLRTAVEALDETAVEFVAHKLKSQFMTIDAQPASNLCAELEILGKNGNIVAVEQAWLRAEPVLEATADRLREELADLRQSR